MISKIRQTARRFLQDEDGAVTVDWVVLTAAVVGLGLVIAPTVGQSTFDLAGEIAEEVPDGVRSYAVASGSGSGEGGEGGGGTSEEGGSGG